MLRKPANTILHGLYFIGVCLLVIGATITLFIFPLVLAECMDNYYWLSLYVIHLLVGAYYIGEEMV